MKNFSGNIIAMATPPGTGAISVFRLSGPDVIEITDRFFYSPAGKKLSDAPGFTLHYGELRDQDEIIDEVLVSVFRAPKSYTGENAVEISVHASPYIQQRVLQWFLSNGVRLAEPGEFTMRAFLNGKMDLAQAEAVADLIAAETKWQHKAALAQLKGGFSQKLKELRSKLVEFASLMELELDFAEEDVEFADREQFASLLKEIKETLTTLIDSFQAGNVIKKGLPVAIVGEPNTGKSTLLNALLNEEKAIVTDIPGTTRDIIEDYLILDGIKFRFIDTAGIRKATDKVEQIGIEKTFEKIGEAKIVLILTDVRQILSGEEKCKKLLSRIGDWKKQYPDKTFVLIINKIDLINSDESFIPPCLNDLEGVYLIGMSAKQRQGIQKLLDFLKQSVQQGQVALSDVAVTNVRHYKALQEAKKSIEPVEEGLQAGLSTDLLTVDIRDALNKLGEITGEVTTEDLLDYIFKNFCIGK